MLEWRDQLDAAGPLHRDQHVKREGWVGIRTCGLTEEGAIACPPGWGMPGRFTAISIASFATCGLTEAGEVTCQGAPTAPPGVYTAVSTGGHSGLNDVCALTVDGKAVWWGGWWESMVPPDPAPDRYVAVSVGEGYACALTDAGDAVCWEPEEVLLEQPDPPPGRYVAVSDGGGHTCADRGWRGRLLGA